MATYRLTTTLNARSVRKVAEEIAEVKRGFNMKVWKATRITAEHIKRFIELQYATATNYIGWSYYDVSIDIVPLPKRQGYRVVGSGSKIYFLEYGTGKFAGQGRPKGGGPEASVDKYPGSWSQKYGQHQYRKGHEWWQFGNARIEGSTAAWAFPYARIYSPEFISMAVLEVFG